MGTHSYMAASLDKSLTLFDTGSSNFIGGISEFISFDFVSVRLMGKNMHFHRISISKSLKI